MGIITRSLSVALCGYQPIAPGWPGEPDTVEATRANPDTVANYGIDHVTDHYRRPRCRYPSRDRRNPPTVG